MMPIFFIRTACALICPIAATMHGVISDTTVLIQNNTTVCLLLDNHLPTLRPHTEPGSYYQPLLHLEPDEGIETQIEHECIARYQTAELKKLIAKCARLGPVVTFVQDAMAPLPYGCSISTTPTLCDGYATFLTNTTQSSSDLLQGLFSALQLPSPTPNMHLRNADVCTALEGILPIYHVRGILDKLRHPTNAAVEPLCNCLATTLIQLRTPEKIHRWQTAIDESLARMRGILTPAIHSQELASFFETETAAIRTQAHKLSQQFTGLKDCPPQLSCLDSGRKIATGDFAHNIRLAYKLVEPLASTLNRVHDLEVATTAAVTLHQQNPQLITIFCIAHAAHIARLAELLCTRLGFCEHDSLVQTLKQEQLNPLMKPAARILRPISLAEQREQIRTSSLFNT